MMASPETYEAMRESMVDEEPDGKKKKRGKRRITEKQSIIEDSQSGSCCSAGPNGK